MAALRPQAGERIVDIGCGAGQTSAELAGAVGADGAVLGVDISRPLLEAARVKRAGVPGLTFLEADAQTYPFEAGAFDAVFSRSGSCSSPTHRPPSPTSGGP
jgi:ubiquinone/menaquinone biosynthesis C-methylase UbiE